MMDLSCGEHLGMSHTEDQRDSESPLRASQDPFMESDPRVLANLLLSEHSSMPTCDYFNHVQDDLQPFMRKVVTTWMLEVCEEQNCEEQVFPLSVNYMDRFLCARAIPRHQLQLLASACLLLASKIRQGSPLHVSLLCAYTDNSITAEELRHWEILLVQKLRWQTSAVTSFDIVEHVLARTSWGSSKTLVRRHAHTLAALCCTETDFMFFPPSMIGTACIVAAARGLGVGVYLDTIGEEHSSNAVDAISSVCSLTRISSTTIEHMVMHVERIVARETSPPKTPCHSSPPSDPPGTPTDVQDIIV